MSLPSCVPGTPAAACVTTNLLRAETRALLFAYIWRDHNYLLHSTLGEACRHSRSS